MFCVCVWFCKFESQKRFATTGYGTCCFIVARSKFLPSRPPFLPPPLSLSLDYLAYSFPELQVLLISPFFFPYKLVNRTRPLSVLLPCFFFYFVYNHQITTLPQSPATLVLTMSTSLVYYKYENLFSPPASVGFLWLNYSRL